MGSNKVMMIGECVLRILSLVFAAMAALLIGLDTQTKTVFWVTRKASVKDVQALWVMTIATATAAGYHLLQLLLGLVAFAWMGQNPWQGNNKFVAWSYFFFDQGVTYMTFVAITAGLPTASIAVFGVSSLQWTKLCNMYAKFCAQVAGGMVCALVAFLAMAILSVVSAHHLFSLYHKQHCCCRRSSSKT